MDLPHFIDHAIETLESARKYGALGQVDALRYIQGHMKDLPEVRMLRAVDRAADRGEAFDDPYPVTHHIDKALEALRAFPRA